MRWTGDLGELVTA